MESFGVSYVNGPNEKGGRAPPKANKKGRLSDKDQNFPPLSVAKVYTTRNQIGELLSLKPTKPRN